MDIEDVLQLAGRIASGVYSQDELECFLKFLDSAEHRQINQVLDAYQYSLNQRNDFRSYVQPDFIDRLRALNPQTGEALSEIRLLKRKPQTILLRWTAAAAVLLLICFGSYFLLNNRTQKNNVIARVQPHTDIKAPSSSQATITLSNGRKVFLDSVVNGALANQANVNVLKLADGQIVYRGNTEEVIYNTLTNPRGSKPATITLTDGTRVWLNSESSMTYPVAFAGSERNVQITGEAYFEVAPNALMPFVIDNLHSHSKIEVLGTHLNVSAYEDEAAVKVTLLEGSIKVSKGSNHNILRPGQQAQLDKNGIKVTDDIDMDEVMAWKNGRFQFGDAADIGTVMLQISRWYDVDVEFRGDIEGHIGGSISRDVNASQVLSMLEKTGAVHFRIEGRKVVVMPASP